ncbi:Protein of unknown function, partial [Gryllus bimaculatus]
MPERGVQEGAGQGARDLDAEMRPLQQLHARAVQGLQRRRPLLLLVAQRGTPVRRSRLDRRHRNQHALQLQSARVAAHAGGQRRARGPALRRRRLLRSPAVRAWRVLVRRRQDGRARPTRRARGRRPLALL